jgi:diguanylate cyclase (GGDEF)-like protein
MQLDYLKKLNSNPGIITNYDLLKNIGILDEIQFLNDEIVSLEELLKKVYELFSIQSINELFDYVINLMIDKFIPSYIAFIMQDELDSFKTNVICYKNMQPIENIIKIESLEPYKKFFSLSPSTIRFNAFENMFDNRSLTDIFLPLNPEMIIPILGVEEIYGFIVVGRKVTDNDYLEKELRYIDRLMKFVSVSLQNNINYKRSIFDSKTRLYNINYFCRRLSEELSRIKRYNEELSLLMIDIDHFKNINDKCGHLVGDKVLELISNKIKENIRISDIPSRFGGEEFIIMLTQTSKDNAFNFAERIRTIIENESIRHLTDKIKRVTISIGISHCSKSNYIDMDTLIRQADSALYESKQMGRNKTTVFRS